MDNALQKYYIIFRNSKRRVIFATLVCHGHILGNKRQCGYNLSKNTLEANLKQLIEIEGLKTTDISCNQTNAESK